jgi:hypothetical protein
VADYDFDDDLPPVTRIIDLLESSGHQVLGIYYHDTMPQVTISCPDDTSLELFAQSVLSLLLMFGITDLEDAITAAYNPLTDEKILHITGIDDSDLSRRPSTSTLN